jgi:hypothetical protein
MSDDPFDLIDEALRSGGPEAGFDFLEQRVKEEKNYPLLFEVRLLQKRHELGLPLIQVDDSAPTGTFSEPGPTSAPSTTRLPSRRRSTSSSLRRVWSRLWKSPSWNEFILTRDSK